MRRKSLLPVVAFLAALLGTAAVRAGSAPAPAALPSSQAAQMPAAVGERSAKLPRLVLADVHDLPAPLATPQPTRAKRRAPAPRVVLAPAPVVVTPTPSPTPVAVAPAPAPPPPSEPSEPKPKPTPAPTFDDSGTGPQFDDEGVSP
jgi:hypothetical protein